MSVVDIRAPIRFKEINEVLLRIAETPLLFVGHVPMRPGPMC